MEMQSGRYYKKGEYRVLLEDTGEHQAWSWEFKEVTSDSGMQMANKE